MLNTLTEIQVANIGVVPLPLRLYGAGLRFCACSRLVSVSFALFSKASLRHFTFTVLSPVKKTYLIYMPRGTLLCKRQEPDFILYIYNNTAQCKRAFQSKTAI